MRVAAVKSRGSVRLGVMIENQQQLRVSIQRLEVLASCLRQGAYPFEATPARLECADLLEEAAQYMRQGFDPDREPLALPV